MLWNPVNQFCWSVDNFGSTYTDTGFATSVTCGAANTKGASTTTLIANGAHSEDIWSIAIGFTGGGASATIRNYLVDIYFGYGGTFESTPRISNLLVNSPSLNAGGYWYNFPLYLPKSGANGVMVGARAQCTTASATIRVGVKLFGKPSHPHLVKAGTKVFSFGATTASSRGTTVTLGTNVMGFYTDSLGTTTDNLWWWQGGLAFADTTQVANGYLIDIAGGDATNKIICAKHIPYNNANTAETCGKAAMGLRNEYRIASGSNVYMRVASVGTPDSTATVMAYGVA